MTATQHQGGLALTGFRVVGDGMGFRLGASP